tara:strand:+ start:1755 stop:2741 length:987 start_codon:yes stop_codon:yes gene_type:complete
MSIGLDEFTYAHTQIEDLVYNTDLMPYKNNIYIKKESQQKTGSFKWSGVLFSVICVFEQLLTRFKTTTDLPTYYYLVTQSTGNHGIALLAATSIVIKQYTQKYPQFTDKWANIVPGIFTHKHIRKKKLNKMNHIIQHFVYNNKAFVHHSFDNYHQASLARIDFLHTHNGTYLEHGGKNIMMGYGTLALSIHRQLPPDSSVALYVAVGAGGIVGAGLCLSLLRETKLVIVQTKKYDAFVRTLACDTIKTNDCCINCPLSDGIAVNQPEPFAVEIGRTIIHKGVTVDSKDVKKQMDITKLGASTCIALAGLDAYKADADYIVVLDCEGNY